MKAPCFLSFNSFTAGKLPIAAQPLSSGELTLHVHSLPPGNYIYTLEIDGRPVANHKLLVQ